MTVTERRSVELEVRATKGRRLEGYCAVFDTKADIGPFVEVIKPGAFAASLQADVPAFVDHDQSRMLARTKSKTLRLSEDAHGLHFDLDVPDTTTGRDILALCERNDIGGASIGFSVMPDSETWRGNLRELRAVRLHEISIVQSFPAYQGTIVSARARAMAEPLRQRLARVYLETLR
jgi:HK97 family phage prohead protease